MRNVKTAALLGAALAAALVASCSSETPPVDYGPTPPGRDAATPVNPCELIDGGIRCGSACCLDDQGCLDAGSCPLMFRCADLASLTDAGQTTGGSVFMWKLAFTTGANLLMIAATTEPNGSANLTSAAQAVYACKGTSKLIRAVNAKYVSPTYTTAAGALNGWTSSYPDVSVQ